MSTISVEEIRQELNVLAKRLEAVEMRLAENGSMAVAQRELGSVMDDVRKITGTLFPGECQLTEEFDPEYPDQRYVVVEVEATGKPSEIVERTAEWHERIRQLSSHLVGKLRLSVVPV